MAKWLGFVVVFGVLTNLSGGNIDNAAHVGGALAGAGIAGLWKRGQRYSSAATIGVLAACGAVLVVCVAILAIRNRTDPFAVLDQQARVELTADAVSDGRCGDAQEGLAAVERLVPRRGGHTVEQVRQEVEEACGHEPSRERFGN
jgi:hypothetical protein